MQEKWIRWEPTNNLSKKYYVDSISENVADKYKIILSDAENNKNKILISWPIGIDAHRSTEESYTLATIDFLAKHYGKEFYINWTFFKVENSHYLKWISEQSYGISDDYNLTHFCILAIDSMIDIAATSEPTVTFITENNAVENYENSNLSDIKNIPSFEGKVGTLADGRIVNVRNVSTDGRPTMEIYDPKTQERTKIRYGNKPGAS